jgi:hypothetical protein
MAQTKGTMVRIGLLTLALAWSGLFLATPQAPTESQVLLDMSPRYDLLIWFAAKTECIPQDGPYLVKLGYSLEVNNIRFYFRTRDLDGVRVDWYPQYAPGSQSAFPVLTFMVGAKIDAELCPHIKCDEEIKKAWFTRQNRSCQAILTVVPADEVAGISEEIIDLNNTGDIDEIVPLLPRYVLHVKILSHDRFAWTGECIVRKQDCGATSDLEFYLGLPSEILRRGKHLHREYPFQSDSIDAQGSLRIWLVPLGNP